jgi:hypothetical protein
MDEKFNETCATLVEETLKSFPAPQRERVGGLYKATVLSLLDLMGAHWKQIDSLLVDDEKQRVSFSLTCRLDVGDKQSKVMTKISYAKRTSDSVELPVNNPEEPAEQ